MVTLQILQAQLRETKQQLAEVRNIEKRAALVAFREQVEQYGITQEEVLTALGFMKPKRCPAQYYDPASGKTWSGRGRRPRWLEGKNSDDFLIDRAPKPWWPGES